MATHYQLTDSEFESAFREGTLSPALFDHEAHLRLAWIHLRTYGLEQAISNICSQLKAFTIKAGAAHKYHHTLTIAAIKTVHHFMQKSRSESFRDFVEEFSRLRTHFRDLIFAHYSMDIFKMEQARQQWLEPDLLPYE